MKFDREVEVPELGEDAYLLFGIDEMETFEALYGEDYVHIIVSGMDRRVLSVMRKCLELMLKDSSMSADDILNQHPLDTVGGWIVDAVSLSTSGKRLSDIVG